MHLWLLVPQGTKPFPFLLYPPRQNQRVHVSYDYNAANDAAQHLLIKSLLMRGLETKLGASIALCSVRAVQRIRLQTQ